MMLAVLIAMLATSASQTAQQQGVPPTAFSAQDTGVERTVAEFMDICFRTKWDIGAVRKAAKASDLGYVEKTKDETPYDSRWESKYSRLALIRSPVIFQCSLSIGSSQARTGPQLLAILRAVIESELGRPVQQNNSKFYLLWKDESTGYLERVSLAFATNEPSQAVWYVFDKFAPGSREDIEPIQDQPHPSE